MTAATTKILEAVRVALVADQPDVLFTHERTTADPFDDDEMQTGAVALRIFDISCRPFEGQSMQEWRGTLACDTYAARTGIDGDPLPAAMVADINAGIIETLWADGDPTLGGMVDEIEPSETDDAEPNTADAEWGPLMFSITWFTRRGNARTIIGRNGTEF